MELVDGKQPTLFGNPPGVEVSDNLVQFFRVGQEAEVQHGCVVRGDSITGVEPTDGAKSVASDHGALVGRKSAAREVSAFRCSIVESRRNDFGPVMVCEGDLAVEPDRRFPAYGRHKGGERLRAVEAVAGIEKVDVLPLSDVDSCVHGLVDARRGNPVSLSVKGTLGHNS